MARARPPGTPALARGALAEGVGVGLADADAGAPFPVALVRAGGSVVLDGVTALTVGELAVAGMLPEPAEDAHAATTAPANAPSATHRSLIAWSVL